MIRIQLLGVLALTGFILISGQGIDAKADQSADMPEMKGDGMSGDMADKSTATEAATMAEGTGVVKAIDKSTGKITLEHGPIPEAKWPAMTMAFKAAPALLDTVSVGDNVAFDLKISGGKGEVTALRKE